MVNVFDSSTISKKIFNRLRKIFSVARNLDLHFVLASQRLQDLNTKIRGRTRLLLGQVSLDDWELKIRRLLRNSKYRTEILTLEVGKFLYTANDSLVQFAKFSQDGKPYLWIPQKPKPKPKKSTWQKIKAWLTEDAKPKKIYLDRTEPEQEETKDIDEDIDEEPDESLLYDEEEFWE